jgi:hypothetical protein
MSKEKVIQQLIFLHGKMLPPQKWWINDDGEVMELEGIAFDCRSDFWFFLNEDGDPANLNWGGEEPAIHQDLLFETQEEAKRAAMQHCQDMISRYNDRFVQLVSK